MNDWEKDKIRKGSLPWYQYWYRKANSSNNRYFKKIYILLTKITGRFYCTEFSPHAKIGEGLYIAHPFNITINPNTVIGRNCNIHKGLTIGQENRGSRKGVPIIGNNVWIGVNVTIVGGISIGDNVLIAPNTFVNKEVPSCSVVYGNPCIIKHKSNATESYIHDTV